MGAEVKFTYRISTEDDGERSVTRSVSFIPLKIPVGGHGQEAK